MNAQPFRNQHVHLIGIGGAGVSALAPLLKQVGAVVSGCDAHLGAVAARMAELGVTVQRGHSPDHLNGVDLVVHTAAVKSDHPELAAARARGIPVMTRGECLVQLMVGTRTVAVAGSHGKTSTTWMLGHLLGENAHDPVVMVGGSVASLNGGGARVGAGSVFVAEVDESDGSFARVSPEIAIITNLDREHLDHWGDFTALEDAFHAWLARIPAHGAAIVPAHGLSERITAGLACRVIRCGLDTGDYRCTGFDLGPDGSRARLCAWGEDLGEISVPLPGVHMVSNAIMAVAAARVLDPLINLGALARCERVRRRFTVHGTVRGVRVVEDYGHHPAEVRATIAAARLGGGRVHVVFQPHRFTRTRDCFAEFTTAFDEADDVALLPIYAASETPIADVCSARLATAINAHRPATHPVHATACADAECALAWAMSHAHPGDTVLVLGAGDVGELAPRLVQALAAANQPTHSTPPLVSCL
jgi:UDP-N-acetylmuramate--alanine ligase